MGFSWVVDGTVGEKSKSKYRRPRETNEGARAARTSKQETNQTPTSTRGGGGKRQKTKPEMIEGEMDGQMGGLIDRWMDR